MSEIVGRLAGLSRFPVKSMGGEVLESADLRWRGLHGDRQYGFLIAGSLSRFPWFTARELSELICWQARYRDPEDPRGSPVDVTAPDCAHFSLDDPALRDLLSERSGTPVELIQLGRGAFDAQPVSLVSTATLAAIEEARGHAVDGRRFRINVVVESDAREEEWAGRRLVIGDGAEASALFAQDRIDRCVMITIDPETGLRSPGLMKTVARGFDNLVGIYASTAQPGTIRLGDVVRLAD
jgi:uncharacterized protein YcbX